MLTTNAVRVVFKEMLWRYCCNSVGLITKGEHFNLEEASMYISSFSVRLFQLSRLETNRLFTERERRWLATWSWVVPVQRQVLVPFRELP